MAPRNIMASVPQPWRRRFAAPPSPGGQSDLAPDQDDILAELGLQIDDSASSAGGSTTGISTMDSGISVNGGGGGSGSGRRRRRRNRNRNNQGGGNNAVNLNNNIINNNNGGNGNGNLNKQATVTIPRQGGGGDRDEKPVRLKLGLDLDVDLELKAKLKGDICISLVAERRTFSKRGSMRAKPNWRGEVDVEEIFHMRIGRFRFRQRWIDREVSESLTVAVGFCIAAGGFVAGLAASRWLG